MASTSSQGVFSVFGNRSFTYLWLGQLVSSMGSALTALAASILVYRVTGSALSVGLMLIATSAPTLFVGLIAGVFVDRYDRKRIMLVADLLRAALIFLIPVLIPVNINWLYVLVALTSGISQFFDSAHASVLPEVADDSELSAANALMAISSVGSMTIGFAAAGIIATSLEIKWAFYLDAVSFLVSALLILLTRIPAVPDVEDTSITAIGQNLGAGLQTVNATPVLRSLFIVGAPVFLIFGLQNTLLLPFSVRELHATEFHFGLQQAAETIGIAIGSLIMARLADRIQEGQWLAISYLSMAVATLVYSLSNVVTTAIFLMGVSGLLNAPSFIGRQLVIQRATPRAMRGRVNSAFFVIRDLMFVAGMALAGLADIFNVRTLFILSSLALLFAGTLVLMLPGLGLPAAEWKRVFSLLRGEEAAPRLGGGRTATRTEIDRFVDRIQGLGELPPREREQLAGQTFVVTAPGGKIVVYRGERSDMAYFILKGSVAAGYTKDDEYIIARYLREGDFFGEIAALTGALRTANVITEEECEFLIIPAPVLRRLARKYPELKESMYAMITDRLRTIELPRGTRLDQQVLRELRTNLPGPGDSDA